MYEVYSHLLGNQLRCRLSRNESCSDYDVHLSALFHEKFHLRLNELLGHLFSIASLTRAILLYVDFNELGPKRLDLFTNGGPSVETTNNSTQSPSLRHYLSVIEANRIRDHVVLTEAIALRPATPAPMTSTLPGGI